MAYQHPGSFTSGSPETGSHHYNPSSWWRCSRASLDFLLSPKLWWTKLSNDLKDLEIEINDGRVLTIQQNPVDPCVFMLIDKEGEGKAHVRGLLLTHVDDLMLLTEPEVQPLVHKVLKEKFPIEDWEVSNFEYVGCEFDCHPEYVNITQVTYAKNRVDKVDIMPDQNDQD